MSQPFMWGVIALSAFAWILTIMHLLRTQERARSRGSQMGWLGLVLFFPAMGVPFYLLLELPRRRRQPPLAF